MSKRAQAKDLIRLALDKRGDENERISAAFKAIRIIDKHDLLSSPLDGLDGILEGNETAKAAKTIFDAITDPKIAGSMKTIADQVKRVRRRG